MGEILLGSFGWTPEQVTAGEPFGTNLRLVEVDSEGALLDPLLTQSWAGRTPSRVLLDVHVYSLLAYQPAAPDSLPGDIFEALPESLQQKERLEYTDLPRGLRLELWARFKEALQALHSRGKLGTVIFRFLRGFQNSAFAREHITASRGTLADFPVSIEFLGSGWLDSTNRRETLEFLRQQQISLVWAGDARGHGLSSTPGVDITGQQLLLRVGELQRDAKSWLRRTPLEEEAKRWLPFIRQAAHQTEQVHVVFPADSEPRELERACFLVGLIQR